MEEFLDYFRKLLMDHGKEGRDAQSQLKQNCLSKKRKKQIHLQSS